MRYVQILVAASVAGTTAVLACSDSENPSSPTRPTPAVAAAAIDCIGVDPLLDNKVYSENRVFLEAQGWWGEPKADGSIPKFGDAEHIHVGMCFPLQTTVSGVLPFRVIVLGHNLRVGSIIKSTNLHDPDGGTFVKINWDDTIKVAPGNLTMQRDVSVNTARIIRAR